MSHSAKAAQLTAKLTLEEKVALLTGRDFWNTVPLPSIGLRNMLLSDGPAGVRGEFWDERDNSLNLPSGTALGSTWDLELAAEYGRTLATEAARKGVDVILGPTINLHRSPLGGRHFECLSEDAMLSGAIAASYTVGTQSLGKGVCAKHYVANDFENDRFTSNVIVDDRTLNELYLRPFEDVVAAGAWSIMSSYNSINGTTSTENELLQDPLRTKWNWDGTVISDWTAVRTLASAKAEQDLVMPGPVGPWGEALVAAVRSGEIDEATVDRKVERILLLALRVGAIGEDGKTPPQPPRHNDIAKEGVAFAKRAATEGAVLLENDGILPVDLHKAGKVALIGHNASAARTQGGGSATVMPLTVSTPLDALKNLLGSNLTYSVGAVVQEGIGAMLQRTLHNPNTNAPGVQVDFFNEAGELIFQEERLGTELMWLGSIAPIPQVAKLRLHTVYTPEETGTQLLGYASVQPVKITLDGTVVIDKHMPPATDDPFESLMNPPHTNVAIDSVAGKSVELVVEVDMTGRVGLAVDAFNFIFGFETDRSNEHRLIDEAVANATAADLAIVVVGTNAKVESEGYDRKNLRLPGRQDDLVEAVVAANPNTIVIVNSGSPVEMPWRNMAKAVLVTYFAGQEMGNALVDLLTGAAEPGGRLPTTWGATLAEVPVTNCDHDENLDIRYEEGIHIGYRAWLKANVEPAYEFGYGLGYTTWSIDSISKPADQAAAADFTVDVTVTNTGKRAGKHVVQVYASRHDSAIDRPVRWLVGFAVVRAEAGKTVSVPVSIRGREFANWDNNGWNYEAGYYQLQAGSSVGNLPVSTDVKIG